MADLRDILVVKGRWCSVWYASRPNGSRLAELFYVSLKRMEQAQLITLFKRISDEGKIHNRTKFKQVEGDIFEFKTRSGVRIGCYQDDRRWFLLDGFHKASVYWPKGKVLHMQQLLVEHRGR